MSLTGIPSPSLSSLYSPSLTGGIPSLSGTAGSAALNPLGTPQTPTPGSTLGAAPLSGGMGGSLMQIMSMLMMLVQALMSQLLGGGAQQQPAPITSQTLAAHRPGQSQNTSGSSSGSPGPGQTQPPTNQSPPANGDNNPPAGSTAGNNNGNSAGWNKNVSVMTSSDAQHETTDMYSGGQLVGGYLHDLENGMDAGQNIDQANAAAQSKNTEGATSANVNPNSLVKGKGGNALIVTGDNYGNDQDADQLADKLKKDYGMNVTVLKNASPNQVKSALQQMGSQKGQQAMVAVLAHGAHDDSGQNKGMMAMGKGDGDQWLSEDALKSEVNQYLAPNYGNVNVLLNSCYSGNFAS